MERNPSSIPCLLYTSKDFPEAKELGEYSDYKDKPTKANASVFITRALEENWFQVQQSDGYMKYIATRPRAERLGDHGLFGDEDAVDLEKTMRELDQYSGNVWTHIPVSYTHLNWFLYSDKEIRSKKRSII